jgi:hypothetical protein
MEERIAHNKKAIGTLITNARQGDDLLASELLCLQAGIAGWTDQDVTTFVKVLAEVALVGKVIALMDEGDHLLGADEFIEFLGTLTTKLAAGEELSASDRAYMQADDADDVIDVIAGKLEAGKKPSASEMAYLETCDFDWLQGNKETIIEVINDIETNLSTLDALVAKLN